MRSADLMSSYSERDLSQGFIVCGITHQESHIFALFPSYVSFARYHLLLAEKKRCFFEVILGDHAQKPHFDIEVEPEKIPGLSPDELATFAEELLAKFLPVLITTFEETYRVKLDLQSDVLIFTSHGREKRSFHIIIDNYAHNNNREAKAFYEEVIKGLDEELRVFIDHSVYSKTQQFRISGSQKKGSGRIKVLLGIWQYQGKAIEYRYREEPRNDGHRFILLLEASLISYTNNCKLLTNLLPEVEAKKGNLNWDRESDDLHHETVKVAFNLLGKRSGVSVTIPGFPYEVRDVIGTLILLKRKYPSNCQICHRIHEHENPYLLVVTDDNKIRHVYFDCRRADGHKLYLGILPEEHNGTYLPDAPIMEDFEEIVAKVTNLGMIPMKEVRQIKKEKGHGL